jgi:hypothetical protein
MKAARQLTAVSMTWGEWKTKADAEDFANAKAMNLSDESEMIIHQEETPLGTVIHYIEWISAK